MKNVFILTIIAVIVFIIVLIPVILLVLALIKYLKSKEVRREKAVVTKSLGETIKTHRTRCKMTQEFVAESLGVSRQAVSKWENGTSDPSTSNLIAFAKLCGISGEELLKEIDC